MRGSSRAGRIPCASLLLSGAAAIAFWIPGVAAHVEYDRAAIAAGEAWRLLTGHWAHYSLDHVCWDVLAFSLLGIACERRSRSRFLVCVFASAAAVSLTVWFGVPDMMAYRGLSGVDSALFTLLFVELWREGRRSHSTEQVVLASACGAGLLLKISFEVVTGTTLFAESPGSGTVGVPLAHMAGATVGFLVGLFLEIMESMNVLTGRCSLTSRDFADHDTTKPRRQEPAWRANSSRSPVSSSADA